MKAIKLTKEQYLTIRKPLPTRHIACKSPAYSTISDYTKAISYKAIHQATH